MICLAVGLGLVPDGTFLKCGEQTPASAFHRVYASGIDWIAT